LNPKPQQVIQRIKRLRL